MPTDIVIPALGESITSGVIATWRKKDGEPVQRDETVLELETDKITLELPSPAAGTLRHKAAEGDTVDVGAIVGLVEEGGAGASNGQAAAAKPAAASKPEPAPAKPEPSPAKSTPAPMPAAASAPSKPAPAAAPSPAPAASTTHTDDVRATPLARKIAEEKGVDMTQIKGTGAGGRIREQDVLAWVQTHDASGAKSAPAPAQPAASASAAPVKTGGRAVHREKMTPLRQRIAQRLVEAQHTAAMLTTFNECDMSAVMELRSRHKEAFEKKHGVGLGFMSFFVKAATSALRAYPLVNSFIVEGAQGPEIEKHDYCDVAVAVSTPKGLTVPVVRNADAMSFAQIESAIRDLATRARDGKLALEELQGGTFTITNGGIYGSMMSTPILNPPQAAILGMHNITERPVAENGEIVIRPMMYLALSYDHRIIDGKEAVTFLVDIKQALEDPARLLLQV